MTVMALSRMLKKSASGVLASLRGSTEKKNQIGGVYPFTKINPIGERFTRSAGCTSSPLHSLRPCWTTFLSILGSVVSDFLLSYFNPG
jgi:hypothetical protein